MSETDFEQTLERVGHRSLSKGDVVYERIRHGMRNGHSKWNKAKVVDCNHSVVRVKFEDDGREAMMRFGDLYREALPPVTARGKRLTPDQRSQRISEGRWQRPTVADPLPAPAAPAAPEPITRQGDDEYQAWLAMGRDMLGAMDRQRGQTDTELRDLAAKLDQIDSDARKRIESLEAELIEAKREHENDRAFLSVRAEQLTTKLASLNDRRQAMAALMGES